MDVGGSMDPHAELVRQLFSAAKRASNIRELKTFYFHNCIYGRVYATERFREPVRVRDVLDHCDARVEARRSSATRRCTPRSCSAPATGTTTRDELGGEAMPGIRWMLLLADHFDEPRGSTPTAELLARRHGRDAREGLPDVR